MNQDDPNNPNRPQTRFPQGQPQQPQQQQQQPQQTFAPQQQFAPQQKPLQNPPSGNFANPSSGQMPNPISGNFTVPNSGQIPNPNFPDQTSASFATNATGFQAQVNVEVFEVNVKTRLIYGASGFFIGVFVGLGLGVLNSVLEGQDILLSVETILEIAIWMGLFTGGVAALRPKEFESIFDGLREKLED